MTTRAELSQIQSSIEGHTTLMRAALNGTTDKVRQVLTCGANVNAQDNEGRTALMFAIINAHSRTAAELLRQDVDVNARAVDGTAALMLAILTGDTESVR